MQTHVKQVSFRLPLETLEALEAIKERDGVPLSEQLRRGLKLWLDQKRVGPLFQKKGKR